MKIREEKEKRQLHVKSLQESQKQLNSEIEQLRQEMSDIETSIKQIDINYNEKAKQHNQFCQQLNQLIDGPVPPPIPFIDPNQNPKPEPEPISDSILKNWNWGAFLLSWIWGIGNKLYVLSIAGFIIQFILISTIPFLGVIFAIGFGAFLGIKGNELAWNKKSPKTTKESFISIQNKWRIAGFIFLAVYIGLGLIAALGGQVDNNY